MRRKYYRKLTEKCNLHDRHSGVGVEVPPVFVEMQTAGDAGETRIASNHEISEIAVGSLNLHMQPLRSDVRQMISEHDAFCLQEVTPGTLPAILAAGRDLEYDVVSPVQRGHTTLEGFDVCMLLRNATLKRVRVGIVPLSAAGIRHICCMFKFKLKRMALIWRWPARIARQARRKDRRGLQRWG